MANHLHKLKERIQYRIKTRHHKGFGIHSPYLFHFINSVIQIKYPYYHFRQIESLRKDQTSNYKSLRNIDFIAHRRNKKEAHCGQIIFRIIQDAQFKTLLELGTNMGMETQYMALANLKARCITVTRSAELAALAQRRFQKQGLNHIELEILQSGEMPLKVIDGVENLDFVLFNHSFISHDILDLFNQCLPKKNNGSIFVFMGIHGRPEMIEAWKKIRTDPNVQVTMDLYNLGIVMFNPELEKKNYVLRTKQSHI